MNSKPYDIDGFVGDFRELLIQFVQMKRSLGFDYYAEANALKRFSVFRNRLNLDRLPFIIVIELG